MDIKRVRAGLGAAASTLVVGTVQLNTSAYTPVSVTVPHFYPADVEIGYATELNTFNGQPVLQVSCYVLTAPEANDQEGQALLDAYLEHPGGSASIKAALESDQTLGGACRSVFVHDIDGYRLYTVGIVAYYGARFRVQVLGG